MKDKTLFEKLFPYHVSQIEMFYGEEKCREYVKEANDWLVSFMWLLGMSCFVVVMTIVDISSLSSRSISKLLLFSIFLLWMVYILITQLKDIYKMTWGDGYLMKKWLKATILVLTVSAVSAGFNIYSIVTMLDFSSLKKKRAEMDELGIVVTIPRGWDTFYWNQIPSPSSSKPTYSFSVSDDYRQMDFKVYGRTRTPETSFKDIEPVFDRVVEVSLDGSLIAGPETVVLHGLAVHRTIGTQKVSPGITYIHYQLIHKGSVISYVYRFYNDRYDLDRELSASERMLKNIELTDVMVPEPAMQKMVRSIVQENVYPYDFSEYDHGIDIRSACMDIAFPADRRSVLWIVRNQGFFNFIIHMKDGSDIRFVLQPGQAEGNTAIAEEEEAFIVHTYVMMDKEEGYLHVPEIVRIGGFSGWKAIGKLSRINGDFIVACYDTWYKGSHLQICAEIPDDGRDYRAGLAKAETIIENIDFY